MPYREVEIRKKSGVFSPGFSAKEGLEFSLFGRLAFAASFAIMIFFIAASGYFIWSGDLLKKGVVAGASDERKGDFSNIGAASGYFFSGTEGKIKESVSVSKLVVEAAKEKENQENNF